ncbi:hypothetical protein MLM_2078 [Mycobacterium lepraemurium]|nr:hypothetical protein MLM_2078 [Mycobacterium lepraemurium]
MTSIADTDDRVVALARGMRDLVQDQAAESEQMRTLISAIVDAMWASGLMSAFNPIEAGEVEPSFTEMIETCIEMAWKDGSFGWVGTANLPSSFAAAAYLPDDGFAEVFTAHDNHVTMGGQFLPNGQGAAVDGGYLVSGAWNFGSGIGHSQYVAAGLLPMGGGEMRWISDGFPEMRVAVIPREQISFDDGWYVQGLKGTGSYDYSARDVFVPAARTFELFTRAPFRGASPATRMGLMPVTAAGHASWALGVAKSMLDDVQELTTKFRMRWQPSTPPTRPAAVPSGRTWSPAPVRSARAAGWSGPSATSTPEPSTPSSARRWPSTSRRSGWASSRTSPACESPPFATAVTSCPAIISGCVARKS